MICAATRRRTNTDEVRAYLVREGQVSGQSCKRTDSMYTLTTKNLEVAGARDGEADAAPDDAQQIFRGE